jgi:endoglucanase
MVSEIPFSRGVNFSKWFESRNAGEIVFANYLEHDFADVKSLGADVIRLPVAVHNYMLAEQDNILDQMILRYIDAAVDWAEKHKIYIIIDNHSFHPIEPTDDNIDKILIPAWEQLARHFKDRSPFVLYEILNEPHGIADERWAEIQGTAIDAIRAIDSKHTIIVGGTNFNSIEKMAGLPSYSDKNLFYTFHFYDPHIFTHQGATWNKPSLAPLKDIPFPSDNKKMPEVHETFKGTWVEKCLENYEQDSRYDVLSGALDIAADFSKERGVPVFCGEFGAFMIQSPPADRLRWYQFVCGAFKRRAIPWISWDYYGGFGIFKTQSRGKFPSDLNFDIVKALGFTLPDGCQVTL